MNCFEINVLLFNEPATSLSNDDFRALSDLVMNKRQQFDLVRCC